MLIMHFWAFIYVSLEGIKDLTVYDQKSYQILKENVLFIVKKMVSRNKNSRRIKSDMQGMRLIDSLIHLKMILKNMEEISLVKGLEINNNLRELETEKK